MYKPKKLKRRKLTEEEKKINDNIGQQMVEMLRQEHERRKIAEAVVRMFREENLLEDESESINLKKATRTTDEIFERIFKH